MEDDKNKVVIQVTSDNVGPLTKNHNLYYDGVSYYENPQGLYEKMLESEKQNQHLFTRVSPEEATQNNWPVVDLSSAERPFDAGIAKKNLTVYSGISNYMNKYNLSYKDAVDLYNTEIQYAKLFEEYSKEYGNGTIINPYLINIGGNTSFAGQYSSPSITRALSAQKWENHKNSYIDELAGMWDKICRYKGDHKNGIGLDKSRKHVQELFNYTAKKQIEEDNELAREREAHRAYIYDADKARQYRNMREIYNSGLLVNDGYKTWMNAQDPTTPEGQARMDQLYIDGTALYRPLSYAGHGIMAALYPWETATALGAGYVGGKATDEVVRRTTDYDSWENLAQKKFDMLPADAQMSNPGMIVATILGSKAGTKAQRAVNNYRAATIIDNAVAATKLPKEYTIVQTQSSRRNPHQLYHTTPANISEAEMAGKPRGVRNQNKSWTDNFMGVVKRTPNRRYSSLAEQPHPGILVPYESNENFGPFLGNGIEQTAYLSGIGKNRIFEFGENYTPTVYKIPSGSFFNVTIDPITGVTTRGKALNFNSLDDIRVYSQKIPAVHNQVPGASKVKLVGYVWSPKETLNGVTYPASFHPVFEQGIAIPQGNLTFNPDLGVNLGQVVAKDLRTIFANKGWNRTNLWFGDEFSKPVGDPSKRQFLTVKDLHSENIGMDLSGNSVIMDPGINFSEPWKVGTETSFPNRFNINASDLDFNGNFPLKGTGRVDHSIMGNLQQQLIDVLKAKAAKTGMIGTTPVGPTATSAQPTFVKPSIKPMITNPQSTTQIKAKLLKIQQALAKKLQPFLKNNNFVIKGNTSRSYPTISEAANSPTSSSGHQHGQNVN